MNTMSKVFLNYFSAKFEKTYFFDVGRVVANKILIRRCFSTETDGGVSHLIKGKLIAAIAYTNVVVACVSYCCGKRTKNESSSAT